MGESYHDCPIRLSLLLHITKPDTYLYQLKLACLSFSKPHFLEITLSWAKRLTACHGRNIVGNLRYYWSFIIMSDNLLLSLETKLDKLILLCNRLQQENAELKARESEWHKERQRLIEKNELARNRVEAMIAHLRNLDAE
jgi:cell division protein ZapB